MNPTEPTDPDQIAEKYENLIEGVRESVKEIADKLRPLTEEIDIPVEPPPPE